MSWEDKHIKELFDKAQSNSALPPTAQEWNNLSAQLSHKGFFQFGFKHFNIYWLGFAIGLGLTIFLLIPRKDNANINKKEKETAITDTLPKKPEIQNITEPSQKTILLNNPESLNSSSEKLSDSIPVNTSSANTDSTINTEDSLKFTKKDQVIQKTTKVNNVVIVKQNNIYIEDSATKSKKQSTRKKTR